MHRLSIAIIVLALSTGCALRPRYRDFITETSVGPQRKFVLYQKDSDATLPGVKLEMSEWKNKFSVTTAADGTFSLPVDKKYLDENPVLVVSLPAGVAEYEIVAARSAPEPTAAGATTNIDAGTPVEPGHP